MCETYVTLSNRGGYNHFEMEKFSADVHKITGLKLTPRQVRAFSDYEQELTRWNQIHNLTAIRETAAIRSKHFLDSLSTLIELKDPAPATIVDIGTGAGFPGIPLKIALPELRLTLVESVGKKCDFCQHLVRLLRLDEVEVLTMRAEEMGQQPKYRERYDWVVARVGGAVLAQKGESAHSEVHAAEKAIRILGGSLRKVTLVNLPGVADDRYLVVVDKVAATPSQYPRRAGIPAKKPL